MLKKKVLQATVLSATVLSIGSGALFVFNHQTTSDKIYSATSDKSKLITLIKKAQDFHSQYWTPATFNQLQVTLKAAQQVNNQEHATQVQVNQATNTLQNALNKMQRQVGVNKKGLQQQIDVASTHNAADFTKASFDKLQAELIASREVINDANATQAMVDNSIWKLRNTGLNLVSLVPLRTQLGAATLYQATNYTPYSFKLLQNAINSGKMILVNPDATQLNVNNAVKQLRKAVGTLTHELPSLTYTQPSGTSISFSKFGNILNGQQVDFTSTSFDQSIVFDLIGNYNDGITNAPQSLYFKPSQSDVETPINSGQLTDSQALDLANFAAGMINMVRSQIGQTSLLVNNDSQSEAAAVATNYSNDNWDGFAKPLEAPHNLAALNAANKQFGNYNLDGECMSYTLNVNKSYLISQYGANMATAKLGLAFDIVRMLYADGGINKYSHEMNLLDLDSAGNLIKRETTYLGLATDKFGNFHIATTHPLAPDEKQGQFTNQ